MLLRLIRYIRTVEKYTPVLVLLFSPVFTMQNPAIATPFINIASIVDDAQSPVLYWRAIKSMRDNKAQALETAEEEMNNQLNATKKQNLEWYRRERAQFLETIRAVANDYVREQGLGQRALEEDEIVDWNDDLIDVTEAVINRLNKQHRTAARV